MYDKYTYTHITITVYIRMPIIYRLYQASFQIGVLTHRLAGNSSCSSSPSMAPSV